LVGCVRCCWLGGGHCDQTHGWAASAAASRRLLLGGDQRCHRRAQGIHVKLPSFMGCGGDDVEEDGGDGGGDSGGDSDA
jgi:hypothetical protein